MEFEQLAFAIDQANYYALRPSLFENGEGFAKVINIARGFRLIFEEVSNDYEINFKYDLPLPDNISIGAMSLTGSSVTNLVTSGLKLPHGKSDAYWGHVPGERCEEIIVPGMRNRLAFLAVSHDLFDESWVEENDRESGLLPIITGENRGVFHIKKLNSDFYRLLGQLIQCNPSKPVDWLVVESLFLSLVTSTIEDNSKEKKLIKPADKLECSDIYTDVVEILNRRLVDPPGLIELARLVGTNEFKLKKCFKEISGNTVYGYLRELRMEKAASLINSRDASITEVAQLVGYNNHSAFTVAFKKHFGMSPQEYKQKRYFFSFKMNS